MDTWRAALDALIACAPGDTSDISWHLADAHQSSLLLVDRTVASPGAERLIDRLMLISAGRLLNHRLDREEAQQISSRLLERAQRRIAARRPSLDADSCHTSPGCASASVSRSSARPSRSRP
ncbi:hypothetical protein ACNUI5_09180 [Pseudomonas aeruginosa]